VKEELSREELAGIVRDTVAQILPTVPYSAITPQVHTKELGADSVDRIEIIASLLDRFGVKEPMAAFSELPDLGALTDRLWELVTR
jgi:polyketide biosynthesis acyl carrier protein